MRIFVASPRDTANYREAAARVAERLNQQHQAKLGTPGYLEVVDWNTQVATLQDLPEAEVLEQLEIGEHDVFVGLAWLAFDANGGGDATTERNVALAFEAWRRRNPEHCLLCRCMRLPEKLSDINGRAFDRVSRFFARFAIGGRNPVPYYEFDSATDLEEYLATRVGPVAEPLLKEAAAPVAPAPAPASPVAPVANEPTTEFERKMQAGKAYEVSFLSIEIAQDESLAAASRANPQGIITLEKAFRDLVSGTAANYGGEIFRWDSRGGLLMFWNNRSFDHAIMTGLKVLHNLPVFNLDPDQNPLGLNIKTQAAAHDAVIIFQQPTSAIESSDIEFVLELERDHTDAGELTITRRLLERIDKRLQPHFKFKDRYDGEPVYCCRLPSSDSGPDARGLQDYARRMEQGSTAVRKVLAIAPADIDITHLEALSNTIDEAYSLLNKFCTAYSAVDPGWRPEMFEQLAGASEALMASESKIWTTLRKAYVSGRYSAAKARKLESIVKTAARRRARPVVILEKLVGRCRQLAGGAAPETVTVTDDLGKRIDAFIKADILDVETALTELLLHHKSPFLDFVASGSGDRRRDLLEKLWRTADLALLDDLYSIRGRQRSNERKVFDVLADPAVGDPRFQVIRGMLASNELDENAVQQGLANGREVTPDDLQVVWRCLVLGHRNLETRQRAAFKLSNTSLWQVISHPSIPISSIQAIGERVYRVEGEDAQKIFFDCTRARVEAAIESARGHDELAGCTKLMLLLMNFAFLVETGYFERFDDLLRRLLEAAQKQRFKVDYFENLRKTLDEARKQNPDKGPSKPPQGIQKLPLTIQRRLAGESRYVYWFVSHPDPRIARETLRHVGLMHIERVLNLREINGAVMNALLRKPELFTRSQAVMAALNHPKCSLEFGTRHIPTLARSRQGVAALQKLSNNPSANPAVRAAAKRAVQGRARAGAR